ncbi:MAG: DNA helicase RecG [Actinobacteria bacterium]|jgi:ATP-dependent DNA helicase RecG|nr:DNA helicase RecG [Actinomycetota bacterium]NCV83335.1 DNA helicase RecG [Actinomycetota bacterium]NCV95323.1 DNA helicase RecG [Actinomycetota bacterium]NCW75604.1 DNA helicase RecG [Actinomycetota bacterium]NCW93548.1 DNA helicase RecG [Actinomycetota bacterium]
MANMAVKLAKVVGDRTAKVLAEELGLESLEDLLRHYPRRYVMRGELTDIEALIEGEEVTIMARIEKVTVKRIPGRKGGILEVIVSDGRAKLILTFFNQAWRTKDLREGREGLFAGKVGVFKGKRQLSHPDYLLIPEGDNKEEAVSDFAGKYLPVYPATKKLPSWKVAQCIRLGIDSMGEVAETLPDQYRSALGFPTMVEAIKQVHLPNSLAEADLARERLTFDEALTMQLFLLSRKNEIKKQRTKLRKRVNKEGILAKFDSRLPFELTAGQKRVSAQIEGDLYGSSPMFRLLQGDVGSGKTIVALRAMLAIIDSGGQAALLAPTEVLAQQHFKNFQKLLGDLALQGMLGTAEFSTRISLLTGSTPSSDRGEILRATKSGEIGILIGTHALLSEGVEFGDLALLVIDEQHRFGVEQRDVLRNRSEFPPHVLVMTATPIPRTVAMTVFGDLDVSTLDELPLGRSPIQTHVIAANEKPQFLDRAWKRVLEEVARGQQAYVVAPRISATDSSDFSRFGLTSEELAIARRLSGEADSEEVKGKYSVEELFPQLRDEALKGARVSALHGRMSATEKEETMSRFSAGEIDVLVSTTVIEVGVDVPNASIMVIMDADRFGVSQLHQLRGRVGRGNIPGLCLLVTNTGSDSPAMARLEAVARTTDGFELSRLDLEQRREGDVLGIAQSGATSHLRLLRVIRDEEVISRARTVAEQILDSDSELLSNTALLDEVDKLRQEERATYLEKK